MGRRPLGRRGRSPDRWTLRQIEALGFAVDRHCSAARGTGRVATENEKHLGDVCRIDPLLAVVHHFSVHRRVDHAGHNAVRSDGPFVLFGERLGQQANSGFRHPVGAVAFAAFESRARRNRDDRTFGLA